METSQETTQTPSVDQLVSRVNGSAVEPAAIQNGSGATTFNDSYDEHAS